jgi:ABC-type multidrug transport system fused ATPase/permease subunit
MNRMRQIHRMVGWRGWGWLSASMLFSLAYSGIELLFAYFLAHLLFLLKVSGSDPKAPFFLPVFFQTKDGSLPFLLLIGLARTLLRVQANQSVILFAEIVRSRLRFTFFRKIYDPRSQRIAQSDINTWLAEIFPKTTEFATSVGNLLTNVVQVLFFFVVMLFYSPLKAVAGLAALLVLGPLVRRSHAYVRRLSRHIIEDFAEVQRSIVRATRNWLLIRLLRTEEMELARLRHASLSTSHKNLRIELVNALSAGLPELGGVAIVATLIALQYGPDPQPAAAFVAFLYIFLRFIQAVVQVGVQMGTLHANYSRFERSSDFLAKVSSKDLNEVVSPLRSLSFFGRSHTGAFGSIAAQSPVTVLIHSAPEILFENVSFSYSAGAPVISDLSFEIPAGAAFGVIGPSGVGKSTLLALLMGVEVPDKGDIRLIAAGERFDAMSHQLTIGYVGPEPFLVAGSVAENLVYGALSTHSTTAMIQALRKAGFSGSDSELGALLTSVLTENGEGLSTGQKQRLCLARALLSRPALLILDEVSANLDVNTESMIAETVGTLRGDSTIVIVSHREGMLQPCDRILDLSTGQLKEQSFFQRHSIRGNQSGNT